MGNIDSSSYSDSEVPPSSLYVADHHAARGGMFDELSARGTRLGIPMNSISRVLSNPLREAALLFCAQALIACADAPLPPKPQEAPMAATPVFAEVLHTSDCPSTQTGALAFGAAAALKGCPHDPHVVLVPAGGGLLVRFTAPVPTNLEVQLETLQGPQRVGQPRDLNDEMRLASQGRAYFYENAALTRQVPAGAVSAREIALWTGLKERRFDLSIWDLSFSPRATGAALRSPAMSLSLVGACPDFAIALTRDSFDLRLGEIRRVHAVVTPIGDGVRAMAVAFSADVSPGLTAALHDTGLASADWIAPRETSFDVSAAPQTPLGKGKVMLRARLGALERTVTLNLNVLPKDDY
jgi:hypothetical protein